MLGIPLIECSYVIDDAADADAADVMWYFVDLPAHPRKLEGMGARHYSAAVQYVADWMGTRGGRIRFIACVSLAK